MASVTIVEDDVDTRDMLERFLLLEGFELPDLKVGPTGVPA
ncbi:MAG TPA: hypothetical protein VF921_03975 [Vicinamibacterales bacterium]